MTKRGRPTIGISKKVSITMPTEDWAEFEHLVQDIGISKSEYLRILIQEELDDLNPKRTK